MDPDPLDPDLAVPPALFPAHDVHHSTDNSGFLSVLDVVDGMHQSLGSLGGWAERQSCKKLGTQTEQPQNCEYLPHNHVMEGDWFCRTLEEGLSTAG